MVLDLLAALERLERAVESSRLAEVQRDDIARTAPDSVAMAKATGLAEGECAGLRMAAERLCKLMRSEGL